MSRFTQVYEFFGNDTYACKITLFGKSYNNVQVESRLSQSDTMYSISRVNKELKAKSKLITDMAIKFIKDSYSKRVTAADLIKHVKPIDVVIEDYDVINVICDYDPWTNAGIGIGVFPEIYVHDRDAFY